MATTLERSPAELEKLRSGQKMVIWAIVLNLAFVVVRAMPGPAGLFAGLAGLIAICMSVIGLLRLFSGLRYSVIIQILGCLVMFVPLVNILILALVNSSATRVLRQNGFVVGLMGAKPKNA